MNGKSDSSGGETNVFKDEIRRLQTRGKNSRERKDRYHKKRSEKEKRSRYNQFREATGGEYPRISTPPPYVSYKNKPFSPEPREPESSETEETDSSDEDEEYVTCSICLEAIDNGTAYTSCNHMFHLRCITQWRNFQGPDSTCPVCRSPLNPR